jgi:hypothetical protein
VRGIILASLWAWLSAAPQQAPPRDRPPRPDTPSTAATGAISGRVHATGTGAPLQGLIVSLVAASPDAPPAPPHRSVSTIGTARPERGPNAVTDASGRFRIADISPGTYRLLVTPGSYRGRYLPMGYGAVRPNDAGRPITIRKGEEILNLDIGLTVGVAIEGRIVDEAGEPLSRIFVFAARLYAGSESAQRAPHAPVITDDLGRYRIYGLEPGTYLVAADSQFAAPQFDASDGRVYALSLGPRDTEPFITTFHPSAVLDAAAQPVRVGAQDATGIDIMLQRARRFRVSGTIVDSQGAPAASTSLILMRSGLGIFNNFTLRTDAEGRFYLPPLEAGNYRVLVGGGLWPGLASVNGRTEFADVGIQVAGDADDLAIVTQPGIGIAGRVVFAEGPPATPLPLQLVFRRPPTATSLRDMEIAATIDDEWRFFGSDVFGPLLVRAPSLPPGWVVKAVTLNGADITDVPTVFTRQHDGQLQIVLSSRPSTLDGTVRGEEAGAALDATVYVFSEDRASWNISSPRTVTRDVREDGTFSVGGLAAGRYYAIAIARAGFRQPPNAGGAFFDLLSKDATPFVIGDDERRTLELRLWHWPE